MEQGQPSRPHSPPLPIALLTRSSKAVASLPIARVENLGEIRNRPTLKLKKIHSAGECDYSLP